MNTKKSKKRKQDNKHLYNRFSLGMSDVQRGSFKFYHNIRFNNFQQLSTTFNNFQQLSATFSNFQQLSATFSNFQMINKIHQGNCLEVLKTLPDNKIDMC